MDLDKALAATQTYGTATVLLFVVTGFLAWLVYYILKQNEKQNEKNERREDKLIALSQEQIASINNRIKEQADSTIEFRKSLAESQRYQREEHQQMMKGIERLLERNGGR